MKIAFVAQPIDPVLPPRQNSIGIWIYEVGRRLAKSHEALVYLNDKGFKGKKNVRINGVKFNAVPLCFDNRLLRYLDPFSRRFDSKRPLFASSFFHLGYVLSIALNLKKQPCDIVHIHNFSQFVPIIRALNPNIKIVLHMHCEWLTQLDQNMIERRLKGADLILSCSEYITQKTRRSFPQFAHRCHTVYNGINTTSFFPKNKEEIDKTDDGHKKILFVGRISPEKGVHILLDAFEKVLERYPNLHLQLVGPQTPAPEEYIVPLSDDPKVLGLATLYSGGYFSHLKKKISRNLVNRVTFYKHIPYSDLINFYHSAHVFVFPSVWDEPFGMPIIEAMACGLPVVATRGGGIPEIVEDGKTGFLVERGDPDTLAEAIVSLIQNQRLRDSIGNAGRQCVLEGFTWDRISEDLLSAYDMLF
jgi:glycosyltransferase involved in cell wall biosynthesis